MKEDKPGFKPLTKKRAQWLKERFNLSDDQINESLQVPVQDSSTVNYESDLKEFFSQMNSRNRPLTDIEWRNLNEPINF